VAARARLRNLKETDSEFWRELTSSENQVPSEYDPQSEDIVDSRDDLVEDDSDVPLGVLIQELTQKKVPNLGKKKKGNITEVAASWTQLSCKIFLI
jgi:hypothetical protein